MATFSRLLLSSSTDGQSIVISTTATPGNLIHTASSTAGVIDEIWLWVTNISTADTLSIEWGTAGTAANRLTELYPVPQATAPILIVQGLVLANSKVLRAYSGAGGRLNVFGYVNRYTP